MNASSPAARFVRWRNLTRACFLLGLTLCLLGHEPATGPRGALTYVLITPGLVLVGFTFLLYSRYCNRCPRCRESFSRAPEYASTETPGLALFERIARCPFCAEPLQASER
jgi:hypothetical protein